MIDWSRFDWETFEAYIAHFQETTVPANYHDVGTSLEIALELASGGQLQRMLVDDYYDLFTETETVQAKKSKGDTFILKNGRGDSKTELTYADYYAVCNYDTRTLFLVNGSEIKNIVEKTKAYEKKDVSVNIKSCKKKVIWSGHVWKTLTEDSPSWFKTKHDAFYDLWYTCKNNVKQQSPLGAFIQ